jgi:hypothetical protein
MLKIVEALASNHSLKLLDISLNLHSGTAAKMTKVLQTLAQVKIHFFAILSQIIVHSKSPTPATSGNSRRQQQVCHWKRNSTDY